MKKLLTLFFTLTFLTVTAFAAETKYGFVDSQEVADNHPIYQAKMKELEKIAAPLKEKIMEKQKEIEKLQEDFEKLQSSVASDEKKASSEKALQKKYGEYQKMGADYQNEIKRREQEMLPQDVQAGIFQDVIRAIKTVSERDGFQVIHDMKTVVYVEPSLNITERAKDELLKNLKKAAEK